MIPETARVMSGRNKVLLALVAGLTLAHGPAPAGQGAPRDQPDPDGRVLPARVISSVVEPSMPALRACWAAHARRVDGTPAVARLEIIIAPGGAVWRRSLAAPRARTPSLERCVFRIVDQWSFPPRAGHTTAVVPLLFLHTRAPGAGPRESCWSPSGCPSRDRARDPRARDP
jgi:hypothetical protein